jgi:hypothetical protein
MAGEDEKSTHPTEASTEQGDLREREKALARLVGRLLAWLTIGFIIVMIFASHTS